MSLRVPNSYIDDNHPEGQVGSRYFRGSGTSESAAMVSGAAALVLQKHPDATPDQVKQFLTTAAVSISAKAQAIGGGELQLGTALVAPVLDSTQTWPSATGTGSLDQSRGTDLLTRDGVTLTGEQDIFGHPFDSDAMAALEADGHSWSGGTWNGNSLVRQQLVRQQLVGQQLVRQQLVRHRGRATRGPAPAGPGTPGRAARGRAARGPADSWSSFAWK